MCGRYILRMQDKYLREWNVYGPPTWLMESYNIARMTQGEAKVFKAKRGMIATTQCFPETPVSCRA
jgi:hypothetical protein